MLSSCVGHRAGPCHQCGSRRGGEQYRRCMRCKAVDYCSEACQREHWLSHKRTCAPSPLDSRYPTHVHQKMQMPVAHDPTVIPWFHGGDRAGMQQPEPPVARCRGGIYLGAGNLKLRNLAGHEHGARSPGTGGNPAAPSALSAFADPSSCETGTSQRMGHGTGIILQANDREWGESSDTEEQHLLLGLIQHERNLCSLHLRVAPPPRLIYTASRSTRADQP
jgi:hypothetical protein